MQTKSIDTTPVIKRFISEIFAGTTGRSIEIRTKPPGRPGMSSKFFKTGDIDALASYALKASKEKADVFFGVGSRDGMGGRESNVESLTCLWLDMDWKDTPQMACDRLIESLPLKPSIQVCSGNGYHLYWILSQEVTRGQFGALTALLANMAKALGGDMKCTDIARIMRLPGTKNRKSLPAKPCEVLSMTGESFELSSFYPVFGATSDVAETQAFVFKEEQISSGNRDDHMTRWCGMWRGRGLQGESLYEKAMEFNESWCCPPLPAGDILKITKSVERKHIVNHPWERFSIVRKQATEEHEKSVLEEIRSLVQPWLKGGSGYFTVQDVYRDLNLSTRAEKRAVIEVLNEVVETGRIERDDRKRGSYLMVNDSLVPIDFSDTSAPVKTLPVILPFGLSSWVKTMPKNIIVLAGEPNVGKTGIMLNMAFENLQMDWRDSFSSINYFSSEMGATEMKSRILSFDRPMSAWYGLKAFERTGDFHQVIDPNGLNFIDFLEISDNFYQVGGYMRSIFDRLENGIAVVAIQKNPGTDVGIGGIRGLEKPRLYLALEPHPPFFSLMKVVKAKNLARMENPNGYSLPFRLINGGKSVRLLGELEYRSKEAIEELEHSSMMALKDDQCRIVMAQEPPR